MKEHVLLRRIISPTHRTSPGVTVGRFLASPKAVLKISEHYNHWLTAFDADARRPTHTYNFSS
jgi:hypothetical protein